MVINNPDYVPESWHLTLLMIAAGICALAFNTFLARHLPLVEGLILVVHVGAFIAVMTVLWVLGPRDTPANVFGQFSYNGWSSQGVSMLTGISAGIAPLVGADGAVHMSEGKSTRTVPIHSTRSRPVTHGRISEFMLAFRVRRPQTTYVVPKYL